MKRMLAMVLVFFLILPLAASAAQEPEIHQVTVLFTHDLHSHLLPSSAEDGGAYGGYARLMTVIEEQREQYPDALLVDAGDFSMGSLFQTAYAASALELRMMGSMGYDVTTFGNHEFDYLPQGLAAMLNAAVDSGEALPAIVNANYLPPREEEEGYGQDAEAVTQAMERYGVQPYVILEKGGVPFVVFGVMGYDADACAPNSGMVFEDPAAAAQRVVDEATARCVEEYGMEPVVIALSHGGTSGGASDFSYSSNPEGEDVELAQKVEGIHLIVSGHSHSKLLTQVGKTTIVSASEYGKYLGVVQLQYTPKGTAVLTEATFIEIDETVEEDPEIAARVEACKSEVEESYLSRYGMTFDQVLVNNPYKFEDSDELYNYQHESTLGNVFSDAYKWAVEQATGEPVDMAVTASGVVRESIPTGDVRVSDIFNAASLGVGTEGELVAIYVTGADLKNAMEVDASVYPLMHSAQLFMSGVEYSFNTSRMIFNKVDYAMLRRDDGTLEEIQDDKLYRIVAGMYMGQMLGSVEETSYGLLTVTPRDAQGNPIPTSQLVNYVVRDENGTPVKEWYAIASYLQEMGEEMDPKYAETDGRKVVYSSWNPVKLLRNANVFTWLVLGILVLVILLEVFLVRFINRRVRRNK